MGIRIDGASDLINATDGSLTIEGQSVNTTGIITASGGMKVGSAATIHSTGQFNIGVAATVFPNGNATFAGIVTAAAATFTGNINVNGNIVGDNSTDISGINDITASALLVGDSIAHTGDTNTKIRFPSADTFTVETNSEERFLVRADGRVSIASSFNVTGVCTAAAFVPREGWLGNRRINVNGAMQVWQRSTSASDIGGSNGYFACDRYRSSNNGSARHTISRDTDEPGGFAYSMKIDVTTANASPSSNNYTFIQHRMEGHDVQGFAKGTSSAQKYALSFWVKSPKTGVHVVQLEDVENSRSVSGVYTIASADTWEKHTIIFPAETSNGITGDSSYRMQLYFWLFAGSTYNTGSVGDLQTTWGSFGSTGRASGQVNVFDSTSNNFYITGIQFEVGSYATPFEHTRYGDELLKCQRYYYKEDIANNDFFTGMGMADIDGNSVILNLPFPVTMRQEPSLETTGTAGDYMIRRSTTQTCSSVPTIGGASTPRQGALVFTKSSHGWADGSAVRCGSSGGSHLAFNAEL